MVNDDSCCCCGYVLSSLSRKLPPRETLLLLGVLSALLVLVFCCCSYFYPVSPTRFPCYYQYDNCLIVNIIVVLTVSFLFSGVVVVGLGFGGPDEHFVLVRL